MHRPVLRLHLSSSTTLQLIHCPRGLSQHLVEQRLMIQELVPPLIQQKTIPLPL